MHLRLDDFEQELANGLHAAFLGAFLHAKVHPIRGYESTVVAVRFLTLTQTLSGLGRDDAKNLFLDLTGLEIDHITDMVGVKPCLQCTKLCVIGLRIGKGDLMCMERALDEFTVELLGSVPTLKRTMRQ